MLSACVAAGVVEVPARSREQAAQQEQGWERTREVTSPESYGGPAVWRWLEHHGGTVLGGLHPFSCGLALSAWLGGECL